MGLLGTVLGFLQIFHALQISGSQANMEMLADGVWKALIYARLGNKKEALAALEEAFQNKQPQLHLWRCDPVFDDLRSEPQAIELSRKMGFEK